MPLARQIRRPLIHVTSRPAPRILIGEIAEPADQPLTVNDRLIPHPPRLLLRPPAPQHRLEHRILGPQLSHPGHQLQARRASQVVSPQPALQPLKPLPFEGRIMHQTESSRNRRGQAASPTSGPRLLRNAPHQATSENAPV